MPGGTNSPCHVWSAAPTYLLPAWVLGVRPLAPGFSEYIVEPVFDAFTQAAGDVPTPLGTIHVAWESSEDGYRLKVDAPRGCKGYLSLKHAPGAACGMTQLQQGANEFLVNADSILVSCTL